MRVDDLWELAILFSFPLAAMLWGRVAWVLFCARTRRGACSVLQFHLRSLLILSILVSLAGGANSLIRNSNAAGPPFFLRGLLETTDAGYTYLYLEHFGYCWSYGFPGYIFLAASLPLVLLLWQSAGEWLQERGRKRPLPKPVNLAWMRESVSPAASHESAPAVAYPSLLWVVAGCGEAGWTPEAMPSCQLIFTYAAPPLWPEADHVGSPGRRVERARWAAAPGESGCSPTQKERID